MNTLAIEAEVDSQGWLNIHAKMRTCDFARTNRPCVSRVTQQTFNPFYGTR